MLQDWLAQATAPNKASTLSNNPFHTFAWLQGKEKDKGMPFSPSLYFFPAAAGFCMGFLGHLLEMTDNEHHIPVVRSERLHFSRWGGSVIGHCRKMSTHQRDRPVTVSACHLSVISVRWPFQAWLPLLGSRGVLELPLLVLSLLSR